MQKNGNNTPQADTQSVAEMARKQHSDVMQRLMDMDTVYGTGLDFLQAMVKKMKKGESLLDVCLKDGQFRSFYESLGYKRAVLVMELESHEKDSLLKIAEMQASNEQTMFMVEQTSESLNSVLSLI